MGANFFDSYRIGGERRVVSSSSWFDPVRKAVPGVTDRFRDGEWLRADTGKKKTGSPARTYPLWSGILLIAMALFVSIKSAQFMNDPYAMLYPTLADPGIVDVVLNPPVEAFSEYRNPSVRSNGTPFASYQSDSQE